MEKDKDNQTELYLNGALAGEELETFSKNLQTDKDLQVELAFERQGRALSDNGQAAAGEAEFKQLLAGYTVKHFAAGEQAVSGGGAKARRIIPLRLWAAAAAVILAAFAGMNWYAFSQLSTSAILGQYYSPTPIPATRSAGEGHSLKNAFAAYWSKDYSEAVRLFEAVPLSDPYFAEAMLFAGYAYFESGQHAAAALAFEKAAAAGDVRFAANAEWHRVLALLADNQENAEARELLNRIRSDAGHPFHTAAGKLAHKLEHPLRKLIE